MRKYILIALVLIVSVKAFAQFPVKSTIVTNFKDREYAYKNFGMPSLYVDTMRATGGTVTVNQQLKQWFYTSPVGFSQLVDLHVSASNSCFIRVSRTITSLVDANFNRVGVLAWRAIGSAGGDMVLKDVELHELGSLNIQVFAGTTTHNVNATVTLSGSNIISDFNFNSPNTIVQVTDSRSMSSLGNVSGGSVANRGLTMYGRRLVEKLKSEGIDCNLINYGVPGETTAQLASLAQAGVFDQAFKGAWAIEITAGINDASLGDATSQAFSTNLQIILDRAIAANSYKNADGTFGNRNVCYFIGNQYGTDVATRQTNAPSYRTAVATVAALPKYAGIRLYVIDYFSAIGDPAAGANANFTETTNGTRLHARGDTGHDLLYQKFYTTFQSSYAYTHFNR